MIKWCLFKNIEFHTMWDNDFFLFQLLSIIQEVASEAPFVISWVLTHKPSNWSFLQLAYYYDNPILMTNNVKIFK